MRGFVCGAFDLLHAGHIAMLKQCKEHCDELVVGLQVDPSLERKTKNRPVESVLEREIRLKGCKYVDGIIVYQYDEEIPIILEYLNINIRFLGSDYQTMEKQEQIIAKGLVPIYYTKWLPPTSSELRRRIKKAK